MEGIAAEIAEEIATEIAAELAAEMEEIAEIEIAPERATGIEIEMSRVGHVWCTLQR